MTGRPSAALIERSHDMLTDAMLAGREPIGWAMSEDLVRPGRRDELRELLDLPVVNEHDAAAQQRRARLQGRSGSRMIDKPMPFVCFQCGERFSARRGSSSLEAHWRAAGHGPKQVQADGIDRARFSVLGDAAPSPQSVPRRKPRPDDSK